MAGDWIKMRVDLADDPAVVMIGRTCRLDPHAVVGRLHRLWCWADRHTQDGRAEGIDAAWINKHIGRRGFAEAMEQAGWLEIDADGVTLPNFERHNGATGKRRAKEASRKGRGRKVSACDADKMRGECAQSGRKVSACDADKMRNRARARAEQDQRREEESKPEPSEEESLGVGLVANAVAEMVAAGVHAKVAEALARGGVTPQDVRDDVAIIAADRTVRQPVALLVARLRDRYAIDLPKSKAVSGDVAAFARRIEALRRTRGCA